MSNQLLASDIVIATVAAYAGRKFGTQSRILTDAPQP
jgi:hypothetical protein